MSERFERRTELRTADVVVLGVLCVVLPLGLMIVHYATMGPALPSGCTIECDSLRTAFAHRVAGEWLWVCIGAWWAALALLKAVLVLRRSLPAHWAASKENDKPVSPGGWIAIGLTAVCLIVLVGVGGDFLLHRFDGGSGSGPITGQALYDLQPDGTWTGPNGARLTLSADGKLSFTGIPSNMFDGGYGPWPGPDGTGSWSVGQLTNSPAAQSGLILSAYPAGSSASDQMLLVPVGSPSSPQLDCEYPLPEGDDCVFTRH